LIQIKLINQSRNSVRVVQNGESKEADMKTWLLFVGLTLAMTTLAEAKGCLYGALSGGVAGHFVHHTVTGAIAGCYMGHHIAHQKARQERQQPTTPAQGQESGARTY